MAQALFDPSRDHAKTDNQIRAFFVKMLTSKTVFSFLSKIDEKKATGLDRFPSNLLKMAASIVAPSFTSNLSKSILTGIYPNDWKTAKVTPLFKKGLQSDPNKL